MIMMERERVLQQADQRMAQIEKRDSILRGRGLSIRLGSGQNGSATAARLTSKQSFNLLADDEDMLLDDADESTLLEDFDKKYQDKIVSLEEAMVNDEAQAAQSEVDRKKPS